MTTAIDPVQLTGLKQAVFVMGCLVRNDSDQEIVRMLGGDSQLYDMWKLFLKHNRWMAETTGGWSVTAKGAMWSKRVVVMNTSKYFIRCSE